ncbi:hypothetical protein D9M68_908620 [compost metagenome]
MFQLTLVDDGHRFETTMRMLADTSSLLTGGELVRAGIVQQQEGTGVASQVVVRKQGADREAVPYPVWSGGLVDTLDTFHGVPPLVHGDTIEVQR